MSEELRRGIPKATIIKRGILTEEERKENEKIISEHLLKTGKLKDIGEVKFLH